MTDKSMIRQADGRKVFDRYCEIAASFAPCMNDYLYVYNLSEDTYFISEKAVDRFLLPGNRFQHVGEVMSRLVHPDDFEILQEDIDQISAGKKDCHNLEYRWIGRDGSPIWVNCKGTILKDETGAPYLMAGCINEIGNKQKADNISGLMGETALHDCLSRLLPTLDSTMFLRIGIDDFKIVNERHGMEYGDLILRKIATSIQGCAGPLQQVYRIISDEFMILDLSGAGYDEMKDLYHRIRASVDEIVASEQYKALYTVSGGLVSLKDIDSSQPDYHRYSDVMRFSEFALTEAKLLGKNQLYYFQPEDYSAFLRKRYLRGCMRKALSNNYQGFSLLFQPIVMAEGELLYAAEALLRFTTASGESISPREFIPILEDSGMIIPVGRWVMRQALEMCRQCREFNPEFMISINLSYIQLLKSPVYDDCVKALEEAGLPPSCLIVELTESGQLVNSPAIQNIWQKLRNLGVHIALDDFGTGYSNLINIGNLKPNIVKIDRTFTVKALQNSYEYDILIYVIKMVHSLGLNLVVEGIENRMELMQITAMNPDYIQGYYYSRPCSGDEFIRKFHTSGSCTG